MGTKAAKRLSEKYPKAGIDLRAVLRMESECPTMDGFKSFSWADPFASHSQDRCGERSLPFLRQPLTKISHQNRSKDQSSRSFVATSPLRENLELSRSEFSALIGISPRILQTPDQGNRRPEGTARALLNPILIPCWWPFIGKFGLPICYHAKAGHRKSRARRHVRI